MISFRFIPFEVEFDYTHNRYALDIGHISIGSFTGSLFYFSLFEYMAVYTDTDEVEINMAVSLDALYLYGPVMSIIDHFRKEKK